MSSRRDDNGEARGPNDPNAGRHSDVPRRRPPRETPLPPSEPRRYPDAPQAPLQPSETPLHQGPPPPSHEGPGLSQPVGQPRVETPQHNQRRRSTIVHRALEVGGVILIAVIIIAVVRNATHSTSPSAATHQPAPASGSRGQGSSSPSAPPVLDYHAEVTNTQEIYTNTAAPMFAETIQLTNQNQTYVPALLRIQIIHGGYPTLIHSPLLNGHPIQAGTSVMVPGAQQISLTLTYQAGADINDYATLEISSNTGIPDKESPAVWFDENGMGYPYGQGHP